jgi:tetratricopeptide (TPR) repeat protein
MRSLLIVVAALSLFAQDDDSITRSAAAAAADLKSGNYAAAERENLHIVSLRPDMAEAHMNLGLSRFLQKHYQDAIHSLTTALKLKPELAPAKLFIGISSFKLNRTAAAVPMLEAYVAKNPSDFQGQYYLGLTMLALERFDEADRALAAARRIDDRDINVLYHLTQSYLGAARKDPTKRDEMAKRYEQAVSAIAAIAPNSYRLAQLRAGAYEADGKRAEAIAELEGLMQHDPRASGLHYTLGCLYIEQRRYDKALEQLQSELKLDGPYPRTYLQLGHVFVELQKPSEALPLLQTALEADPASSGLTWMEMGRAYRGLNQPEKSIAAFEKAVALGEGNSSVYYQLAMVAKKAGKDELARDALAKSQQLRAAEPKHVGVQPQ